MNMLKSNLIVLAFVFSCVPAIAQPPGGGDRGGDRGGFGGGPPGGGFGGRGGPPGGGFGGPPGGGFGGPPGGESGGRGGPPGGGDRGGSSRGSFDPSSFLTRLDANGNGILDPEEQQGPAQFLISRMQQGGMKIEPGKPISLKTLTKGFEDMQKSRESGGGNSSRGNQEPEVPELLVPGFGIPVEEMPTPPLGFGAAAEMLATPVAPEDLREAEERMRRYDENKDGFLTKNEVSRFSGSPMDFDRNRDGKLSVSELAVRYARRRETEESSRDERKDRRDRGGNETVAIPDVYDGRKSYRATPGGTAEGLPGWFTDKDKDQDGQVSMAEYAGQWNDDVVTEFFNFDLSADGVITEAECLRAVNDGAQSRVASASSASPSSGSTSTSSPAPDSSRPATTSVGQVDDKTLKYAEKIISRYDANKDGSITATEWKDMLIDPSPADANRDGRVSTMEYAQWMQQRSKR